MAPGVGRRLVLVFLACAVAGVIIFGELAWRAVTIEEAASGKASDAFAAARAAVRARAPLVDVDDQGEVTRREQVPDRTPQRTQPPQGDGLPAAHRTDRQSRCPVLVLEAQRTRGATGVARHRRRPREARDHTGGPRAPRTGDRCRSAKQQWRAPSGLDGVAAAPDRCRSGSAPLIAGTACRREDSRGDC